jgi:hypothetical protein
MYFEINQRTENDLNKTEAVIQHARRAGLVIAMDSNSTSTSWHDTLTNTRDRLLKQLTSKQFHITNEESAITTFQSSRGSGNIDLTVISKQSLRAVEEWEISGQQSCLDHSIINLLAPEFGI